MAVCADISSFSTEFHAVRVVCSLKEVDKTIDSIIIATSVVCVVILLLLVLTGTYFVGSIIKPIMQISSMAEKFAKGDFSSRIRYEDSDEIGDLCKTINYMADELSTAEEMKNEFLNNNGLKYGKFIMLEHHKFKYGHNWFHHIFNTESKLDGCITREVIKCSAFRPSIFNWRFSHLAHIWRDMIERCYNPKCDRYNAYGDRGIKICRLWYNPNEDTNYGNWKEKENFKNFCLYNGFIEDQSLQIDRYDNNGNYCPENCQLVSKEYNNKFKGRSNIIHINFARLIDIYDVERAWEKFLFKDNKTRIISKIWDNVKNRCDIYSPNSDKIRLDESVYFILNNLPIEFIDYCDSVLTQNGLVYGAIPVYWDRHKPWYKTEWLNSYRIS